MIEDQFLPYFITEDIYQVAEKISPQPETVHQASTAEPVLDRAPASEQTPESWQEIAELAIWTPPLTTKDRELLSNILKAIRKDLTDALLMEGIASYHPHFKMLICFGYQKELELKAGKAIPMYQVCNLDGRTFLASASPADLVDNKNEKSRLWTALKEMFSV